MTMSDELIADRSNYGDPVENHRRIAKMWSAWLGHEIQPHQVACMMVLVKLSRMVGDRSHQDNYDDAISYLEIAEKIVSDDIEKVLTTLEKKASAYSFSGGSIGVRGVKG
jgi:hypothetical protein